MVESFEQYWTAITPGAKTILGAILTLIGICLTGYFKLKAQLEKTAADKAVALMGIESTEDASLRKDLMGLLAEERAECAAKLNHMQAKIDVLAGELGKLKTQLLAYQIAFVPRDNLPSVDQVVTELNKIMDVRKEEL